MFVFTFRLHHFGQRGVPIGVELRLADVAGMNVTRPRDVRNGFSRHAIVVNLMGRTQNWQLRSSEELDGQSSLVRPLTDFPLRIAIS